MRRVVHEGQTPRPLQDQGKPRAAYQPVRIEWAQPVQDLGAPVPNGWLVQHTLGQAGAEPSLAELTGLVFKLPG